jgi:hypothetical protein
MNAEEIKSAVEAALSVPGPVVYAPPGAPMEMLTELYAKAAEVGRKVKPWMPQTRAENAAAEFAGRDVPEIKAGDNHAFIKNLAKIARGDVRVK